MQGEAETARRRPLHACMGQQLRRRHRRPPRAAAAAACSAFCSGQVTTADNHLLIFGGHGQDNDLTGALSAAPLLFRLPLPPPRAAGRRQHCPPAWLTSPCRPLCLCLSVPVSRLLPAPNRLPQLRRRVWHHHQHQHAVGAVVPVALYPARRPRAGRGRRAQERAVGVSPLRQPEASNEKRFAAIWLRGRSSLPRSRRRAHRPLCRLATPLPACRSYFPNVKVNDRDTNDNPTFTVRVLLVPRAAAAAEAAATTEAATVHAAGFGPHGAHASHRSSQPTTAPLPCPAQSTNRCLTRRPASFQTTTGA